MKRKKEGKQKTHTHAQRNSKPIVYMGEGPRCSRYGLSLTNWLLRDVVAVSQEHFQAPKYALQQWPVRLFCWIFGQVCLE